MKSISSRDYFISHEQMLSFREKGQLQFSIDRLTGEHLTNNLNILQLADNPKLLKSTWRAHNFWTYLVVGFFLVFWFTGFYFSWWLILIGFAGMLFFYPILVKSHEENLLNVLIEDKGLYESMCKLKRLNYLVDEEIIPNLAPRTESDNEHIETIEKTTEHSAQIIGDFGATMEEFDWLSGYHDVNCLSHSKDDIRNALISSYNASSDADTKGIFKTGLMALTHFQKDIGSEPIMFGSMFNYKASSDELSTGEQLKEMASHITEENNKIGEDKINSLKEQATREYENYMSLLK